MEIEDIATFAGKWASKKNLKSWAHSHNNIKVRHQSLTVWPEKGNTWCRQSPSSSFRKTPREHASVNN